ncbi:carbamoyl phosphate synthetase B [Klebsormidium nitens]|uniref:Carbamoyl phosphate synthase arginine-specific large chain, chloroplastic n=1 Tax=Klebsormidium nitens TaxID=105231 RepID=A0A1Y1ISC5_KLENI|nr:carbamoyl phosphate synthetase B [Klebsormidium nitens]|eukprot:GAQ91068.1 carbamoyl phosphate synthetase B [Klebsormidium nitens]
MATAAALARTGCGGAGCLRSNWTRGKGSADGSAAPGRLGSISSPIGGEGSPAWRQACKDVAPKRPQGVPMPAGCRATAGAAVRAEHTSAADGNGAAPFTAWDSPTLSKVSKRTDLKKIMILGAGPIVIGQACEFDYSGTQACKALKQEGYQVVLLNSNPATIMTDPGTADRTYVAPMTPELATKIIEQERPDALLPTMGGQTALNLAVSLSESGVLEKYGVELIGAKLPAIQKAEDRDLFKKAMEKIGVKSAPSGVATTMDEAWQIAGQIGDFPLIIRPAFTLGGSGGGIAYNKDEFETICKSGLAASSNSQILVEKSLLGWKEYELEVMRDLADNVVIICSIENIDPMGVHTGDSITVAPAQTLTDREYQRLRDYSVAIIREIGVECGGSNVQFSVNPEDGEVVVIEMNPRVSRSSALASKATGFPIAKMAAKLAVGYTLDRIPNDITLKTPASFEPSIDYVVTKIPRFAFEKFPGSEPILTTQMKSVGEAMAIGRTFEESFQKALRSLETGHAGFGCGPVKELGWDWERLKRAMRVPNPERMAAIYAALRKGMPLAEVQQLTMMDPWFLHKLESLVGIEKWMGTRALPDLTKADLLAIKRRGFSDKQIAYAVKASEEAVREARLGLGVVPAYKRVDTCAAEFEAFTPYQYSSYDAECESEPTAAKKVLILGGGPNRIGQGIEFDYCCCHASFSLQDAGYETIMMNSNPETVSTDYDTSNRLYFEPLTVEDVINIITLERPDGIIVQFGGQTPLKLALPIQRFLEKAQLPAASGEGLVRIWGTPPDAIDAAEDRERFEVMLRELGIEQPPGGIAESEEAALAIAARVGYPVVVRPSYVLGGRAMEIVYDDARLGSYLETAVEVDPERPVLVDKYLQDATELDVDALADGQGGVVIGGIMEHIEQAGVHSGDSACSLPTQTIGPEQLATVREWTRALALKLGVCGLMNIQYAVMPEGQVYIIEANPRASRTVPFVSKAIGHPLAKYASLVMSGRSLADIGFTEEVLPAHVSVKEAVLPFDKFPGADTLLGPEMRSTGEVMGIDDNFAMAFAKAQLAANQRLPLKGAIFVSMNDALKERSVPVVRGFADLGFSIYATGGTAATLRAAGIPVNTVLKLHEGRPHIGDMITNGQIALMFITSTTGDALDAKDGRALRRTALAYRVPIVTTIQAGSANLRAIKGMIDSPIKMRALQDYFQVPETAKV